MIMMFCGLLLGLTPVIAGADGPNGVTLVAVILVLAGGFRAIRKALR